MEHSSRRWGTLLVWCCLVVGAFSSRFPGAEVVQGVTTTKDEEMETPGGVKVTVFNPPHRITPDDQRRIGQAVVTTAGMNHIPLNKDTQCFCRLITPVQCVCRNVKDVPVQKKEAKETREVVKAKTHKALDKIEEQAIKDKLHRLQEANTKEHRKWQENAAKQAAVLKGRARSTGEARDALRLARLPQEMDDMENALKMAAEAARKRAEEERVKVHRHAIFEILKKVDEVRRLQRSLEALRDGAAGRAREYLALEERQASNAALQGSLETAERGRALARLLAWQQRRQGWLREQQAEAQRRVTASRDDYIDRSRGLTALKAMPLGEVAAQDEAWVEVKARYDATQARWEEEKAKLQAEQRRSVPRAPTGGCDPTPGWQAGRGKQRVEIERCLSPARGTGVYGYAKGVFGSGSIATGCSMLGKPLLGGSEQAVERTVTQQRQRGHGGSDDASSASSASASSSNAALLQVAQRENSKSRSGSLGRHRVGGGGGGRQLQMPSLTSLLPRFAASRGTHSSGKSAAAIAAAKSTVAAAKTAVAAAKTSLRATTTAAATSTATAATTAAASGKASAGKASAGKASAGKASAGKASAAAAAAAAAAGKASASSSASFAPIPVPGALKLPPLPNEVKPGHINLAPPPPTAPTDVALMRGVARCLCEVRPLASGNSRNSSSSGSGDGSGSGSGGCGEDGGDGSGVSASLREERTLEAEWREVVRHRVSQLEGQVEAIRRRSGGSGNATVAAGDVDSAFRKLRAEREKLAEGRRTLEAELTRRLEGAGKGNGAEEEDIGCALCKADEDLAKLEDEIARLRSELSSCLAHPAGYRPGCAEDLTFQITRLREEVDRRKALLVEQERNLRATRKRQEAELAKCRSQAGGCSEREEQRLMLRMKRVDDELKRRTRRSDEEEKHVIYYCLWKYRSLPLSGQVERWFSNSLNEGCPKLKQVKGYGAMHGCLCSNWEREQSLQRAAAGRSAALEEQQKQSARAAAAAESAAAARRAADKKRAAEVSKELVYDHLKHSAGFAQLLKESIKENGGAAAAAATAQRKVAEAAAPVTSGAGGGGGGSGSGCPGPECDAVREAAARGRADPSLVARCVAPLPHVAVRANIAHAFNSGGDKATGCALLAIASNPSFVSVRQCICGSGGGAGEASGGAAAAGAPLPK